MILQLKIHAFLTGKHEIMKTGGDFGLGGPDNLLSGRARRHFERAGGNP